MGAFKEAYQIYQLSQKSDTKTVQLKKRTIAFLLALAMKQKQLDTVLEIIHQFPSQLNTCLFNSIRVQAYAELGKITDVCYLLAEGCKACSYAKGKSQGRFIYQQTVPFYFYFFLPKLFLNSKFNFCFKLTDIEQLIKDKGEEEMLKYFQDLVRELDRLHLIDKGNTLEKELFSPIGVPTKNSPPLNWSDSPKLSITTEQPLTSDQIKPVNIFTDGYKSRKGVGAAFVVYIDSIKGHSQAYQLPNFCSVFQSELLAILQALRFLDQSHHQAATIYTDSLSSLEAMVDLEKETYLLLEMYTTLKSLEKRCTVTFNRIKNYAGHFGDEKADLLAKYGAIHGRPFLLHPPHWSSGYMPTQGESE